MYVFPKHEKSVALAKESEAAPYPRLDKSDSSLFLKLTFAKTAEVEP
jgi:hypothetical protein